MRNLQKDFTTLEQSKRLLKLGVPRWSADEYIDQKGNRHSLEEILDIELFFQQFPDYHPCWSVGRLIEIFSICFCHSFNRDFYKDYSRYFLNIDAFINEAEKHIRIINEFDFSKLK